MEDEASGRPLKLGGAVSGVASRRRRGKVTFEAALQQTNSARTEEALLPIHLDSLAKKSTALLDMARTK